MLTLTDPVARATASVFDEEAVARDLAALVTTHSGREQELRTAVAQRLKMALTEGRAAAEQLLLQDRHGRRCAERLCAMQDGIIRVLFQFAAKYLYKSENPSE